MDIHEVISTIDSVNEKFSGKLSVYEKKLLDEVLNICKELKSTNGSIDASIENLKLVNEIKARLNKAVLSKDYIKSVSDLVNGMGSIITAQLGFFNTLDKNITFGDKYKLLKNIAVDNLTKGLTQSGIEANVTSKLSDMVLKSITTGTKYADLVTDMTNFLTTDEKSQGALTRYAQTYANTSVNQLAGQYNKLLTDDLGLEWFMYVGSNKETSREFCEFLVKKKYIHKSEIPDILNGIIDGHQCKIYERTGLPYGMIEGTTKENFQVNNGGWNCGHKLTPVNAFAVPKNLVDKFK